MSARKTMPPSMRWGILAVVLAYLIAAFVLVANPAKADPNIETQLPANGVLAIERVDATHVRLVFAGVPTEVKYLTSGWSGRAEQCGVNAHANYGIPLCEVSIVLEILGLADCQYWQVDGIPGENSSDPYVCRPLAIQPSPEPSTVPEPEATNTPRPNWEPDPTATPRPTFEPSPLPTDWRPTADPTSTPTPLPPHLADTGKEVVYPLLCALLACFVALMILLGRQVWPGRHGFVEVKAPARLSDDFGENIRPRNH